MAKVAGIIASLLMVAPLVAQGPQGAAVAQVSARILKASAWAKMDGYDPSKEVRLQGVVERTVGGFLQMRMPFGSVQIEIGRVLAVRTGQAMEVVVSKVMRDGAQRLLARELRIGSTVIQVRDAQGLPMEVASRS
ncbi:MAG: hypothetical protein JST05_11250 [Acidobacteria bacterium]|nr:hypothetical protein [Acidobacteriota bacterium]